jgi:hypothetical protein
MDLFLTNLGPVMAYDICVSAFFFSFCNNSIKSLNKVHGTLKKIEIYSLEHIAVGEKVSFSIDPDQFNDKKISCLFKLVLQLKWEAFDNKHHSIYFIFNERKKRFIKANILKRIHLMGQRFIHANLKKIY